MINITGTLAIAFALGITIGLAQAQTGTPSGTGGAPAKRTEMSKKPIEKVTCEEFNGLEDTFKPKVIAWAAGYKEGQKKPDVVAIDIDGVDRVTPFIVDECKKAPQASFWSKVDSEFKKAF